ncbi:MAG: tRNA (adenosine(37)-N6)-threonylcarbamoyltransferase complex transferase subunit TsaD [Verrucomicrobiota bacterium]
MLETIFRGNSDQALVLALETSCDESAAALMRGTDLLAAEVFSQVAVHGEYGGVVPEVASRSHLRALRPLLELVLKKAGVGFADLDAVAATSGPGLATSLMVGLSLAKGIAVALRKPFIPVNHIEGHLLSPFLSEASGPRDAIGLVVSGGHTLLVRIEGAGNYRLLGKTMDDAAGEAFDKVGKLLGLPYPGGPHVSLAAERGSGARFTFPRSMLHSGDFNFSFSGLKTAVRYLLPKCDPIPVEDICAGFQEAVVDVLVAKAMRAVAEEGVDTLAISGGVSCNAYLRHQFAEECSEAGVHLLLAPRELCTDNAAMIAYVAALKLRLGAVSELDAEIAPNLHMLDRLK